MKPVNRKIVFPAVAALTLLVYSGQASAYSSVTATASISFSEYSTYYRAIGKGIVKAYGSPKTGQRIENRTIFQHNESYRDIDEDTSGTSPVTVTITSGKEGDDLEWHCSVIGSLWEGSELDWDEDFASKKYKFR